MKKVEKHEDVGIGGEAAGGCITHVTNLDKTQKSQTPFQLTPITSNFAQDSYQTQLTDCIINSPLTKGTSKWVLLTVLQNDKF